MLALRRCRIDEAAEYVAKRARLGDLVRKRRNLRAPAFVMSERQRTALVPHIGIVAHHLVLSRLSLTRPAGARIVFLANPRAAFRIIVLRDAAAAFGIALRFAVERVARPTRRSFGLVLGGDIGVFRLLGRDITDLSVATVPIAFRTNLLAWPGLGAVVAGVRAEL